jgi:hypothetical protein
MGNGMNPLAQFAASNRRWHSSIRSFAMNRYDPRTPRTLAGLAAAAITTATFAIAVVMPATSLPRTGTDDIATRVTTEQCVAAADNTITAMYVVAVRHPHVHAMPIAQSRGTAHDAQG